MALAYVPAYLFAVSSDTLTFQASDAVCNTRCHHQLQPVVYCGLGQQQKKKSAGTQ